MSQENVESLRELLLPWSGKNLKEWGEAWSSGAVDLSLLDPDIEYEDTSLPDHVGETYHGHDGVSRAMERWAEPYEDLTTELERIVGTGDALVSIHRVRSRAAHTGIEFDTHMAYFWRFRDGQVIGCRSYWKPEDALAAAGLRE